jgi:hypothetical protein
MFKGQAAMPVAVEAMWLLMTQTHANARVLCAPVTGVAGQDPQRQTTVQHLGIRGGVRGDLVKFPVPRLKAKTF